MRRLVTLLVAWSTLLSSFGTVALAQEAEEPDPSAPSVDPTCGARYGGNNSLCGVKVPSEVSTGGATSAPPGVTVRPVSSSRSSKKYVPYNRLTSGPDGQPCVSTGYIEEGGVPSDSVPDDSQNHIEGAGGYSNLFAEYSPCPEQPRAPGQAEPIVTRAMIVAQYWERIPLPKPRPSIAPGRAITGKLGYLETNGDVTHTFRTDTFFGPLEISAHGSYTVNWGDGQTTGPYSFEGRPWPEGRITHEYLHVGSYDIVVTERWTANWNFAGERGVLRTLQTTGRIDDFPVEQIQAVIGR